MKIVLKVVFIINLLIIGILGNDKYSECFETDKSNIINNNYYTTEKKEKSSNNGTPIGEKFYIEQLTQTKMILAISSFLIMTILAIFGFLKGKELSNIKKEFEEDTKELKERNKEALINMHKQFKYHQDLQNKDLDLLLKRMLTQSETNLNGIISEFRKDLNKNWNEEIKEITKNFVEDINKQLKTEQINTLKDEVNNLRKDILILRELIEGKSESGNINLNTQISNGNSNLNKDVIESINFGEEK